jgi:hypothetical protein
MKKLSWKVKKWSNLGIIRYQYKQSTEFLKTQKYTVPVRTIFINLSAVSRCLPFFIRVHQIHAFHKILQLLRRKKKKIKKHTVPGNHLTACSNQNFLFINQKNYSYWIFLLLLLKLSIYCNTRNKLGIRICKDPKLYAVSGSVNRGFGSKSGLEPYQQKN